MSTNEKVAMVAVCPLLPNNPEGFLPAPLRPGAKLKEIGRYFDLSDSGVSKVRFRLRQQLEKNPELRDRSGKEKGLLILA